MTNPWVKQLAAETRALIAEHKSVKTERDSLQARLDASEKRAAAYEREAISQNQRRAHWLERADIAEARASRSGRGLERIVHEAVDAPHARQIARAALEDSGTEAAPMHERCTRRLGRFNCRYSNATYAEPCDRCPYAEDSATEGRRPTDLERELYEALRNTDNVAMEPFRKAHQKQAAIAHYRALEDSATEEEK